MRNRLVFISDVHIGVAAPTNWYQPTIHEPLLTAALDWVIERADSVGELILLGDFVDQWTYVPTRRPPTFAEIAAANPGIFAAPSGALPRALDALGGAVTYVGGNHDMSVSTEDVASIRGTNGRSPRHVTAFPYMPEIGLGQLACAHGHQFSVFNAEDRQAMPATGIPLGHVVTRIAALWSARRLAEGQTVADLPGAGEPTGWALDKDELGTLLVGVIERKDSLPVLATNALLEAVGESSALPIAMLDGSTPTVAELQRSYGDLFTRYKDSAHFPGSGYGIGAAYFALLEADLRNRLDHFARQLGKHHKVVVMGHTHNPEDATQRALLFGDNNVYANSGFNCPAGPDLHRAAHPVRPSFVEVEVDAAARRFHVRVHAVAPAAEGRGAVVEAIDDVEIGF